MKNQELGSSETTREASFNFAFSNYTTFHLCAHHSLKTFDRNFAEWFLGFVEGDGSFVVRTIQQKNQIISKPVFEITQKDPKLMYHIRKNLGYGRVISFVRKSDQIYWRYSVYKKQHLQAIACLFNGNIVLEARQTTFQIWLQAVNRYSGSTIKYICVPRAEERISLTNGWLSGFLEADGGFYSNILTNFTKGKLLSGEIRYGITAKIYLTQKNELKVLEKVRDLLGTTVAISQLRNGHSTFLYNRLDVSDSESLNKLIHYLTNYPFQGQKKLQYLRWKRIFEHKVNKYPMTEISARKLRLLVNKLKVVG